MQKNGKKYIINLSKLVSESKEEDNLFWSSYINSENLFQELNFLDNETKNTSRLNWISKEIIFTKKETSKLLELVDNLNLTLFQFLSTCIGSLIYKYNSYENKEKIKFCYTVNVDHTKNFQGCHTNINPLFVDINSENSLKEIAEIIKNNRKKIKSHQTVPFEKIIENIKSNNPFYKFGNVIINHSPALVGVSIPRFKNLKVKLTKGPNTVGFHELAFTYNILDNKLYLQIDIISYKSSRQQLKEICKNFRNIVDTFLIKPKTRLSEIPLLTDFQSYNGITKNYPQTCRFQNY